MRFSTCKKCFYSCFQAIEETAKYFKVQPIVMEGVAHDCMLDTRWEKVAEKLNSWLQGQV